MSEREHAGGRRRRPRSSTAAASSAPNWNITAKESGVAGDITIVRPAAAAPPRRRVRVSLQVEMRRASPLSQLLRSGRGEADPVPESGAAAASNRKSLKRNRRRRRRRPHHRAASSRCTAQAARAGRATSPRQILRHPRAKG